MKKFIYLQGFLIFGLLIYLTVNTVQAQYVTLEGRQFKDENGNDFYPVCMNYVLDIGHTDGMTDYYIMPTLHYGVDRGCDCSNQTTCYDRIEHDLDRIQDMGFNTVHLVGITPYSDTSELFVYTYSNVEWWNIVKTKHYFTHPYINDTFVQLLFNRMDSIITKANERGLKIILDCQHGDSYGLATYNITEYISALSDHINNSNSIIKQTLIGYVLAGEPAWYDLTPRTKQDVCELTRTWYDTIKSKDPNHLVACGGMHYIELFKWDPAVIKMDFYFPHVYPYFYNYEDTNNIHSQYAAMNRVNGTFYWLNKNCPVPWMIGETSLSADSVYVPGSGMHGNVTDQANYIDTTLKNVRNCGGSGYSVWQYQEVWWDVPENGKEDNFGLLYHGDQYSLPLTDTSLEKPAVTKFRYFNPNRPLYPCNQPANYYDPNNWELFSPGYPKTLSGTITETGSGNPIEDAYIVAWVKYIPFQGSTDSLPSINYTFSNSNGDYSLNPNFPNSDESMYDFIGITAAGAATIWPGKPVAPYNNYDYSLNYNPFKYDNVVNNQTVSTSRNFQGWSTLTVSNTTVQTGVTSEFKARDEVTINGEFTADLGSEVYIYCTETFPECNSYQGFKSMIVDNPVVDETFDKEIDFEKQMEVSFIPVSEYAFLDVFPNPGNGIFTLNYRTNKENISLMQVNVYDITGSCVYKTTLSEQLSVIDLSFLSNGIYYLHASTNEDTFNQKLIIN